MLATDEDALVCDFAETYRILDFRMLSVKQAAVLACGLRADSRIMQRLAGLQAPVNTFLLGAIADALKILVWQNTADGVRGRNRPGSILAALLGSVDDEPPEGFETAAEFEAWHAAMLGGEQHAR